MLTGALKPARFRDTDAVFNVAAAFVAVQILPPDVWIVMNGRVFDPAHARKNREANRFEDVKREGLPCFRVPEPAGRRRVTSQVVID